MFYFFSTFYCGHDSLSKFVPRKVFKNFFLESLQNEKSYYLCAPIYNGNSKEKKFFDNIAIAASQDPC